MFAFTNKQKKILLSVFTFIFIAISGVWYNMQSQDGILISSRFAADQGLDKLSIGNTTDGNSFANILNNDNTADKEYIYVHVKGAVNKAGVYSLEKGSRVVDAIEAAGGGNSDANLDLINLASKLQDGQEVIVYTDADKDIPLISNGSANNSSGKININTANSQELQTLPGIGSGKADTIIKYREKNGPFQSVEDLLNISGIGVKTLEAFIDEVDAY